jgi:hypothetical protein
MNQEEDKPSNLLPVTVLSLNNDTVQIDGITLVMQDHQMWFKYICRYWTMFSGHNKY